MRVWECFKRGGLRVCITSEDMLNKILTKLDDYYPYFQWSCHDKPSSMFDFIKKCFDKDYDPFIVLYLDKYCSNTIRLTYAPDNMWGYGYKTIDELIARYSTMVKDVDFLEHIENKFLILNNTIKE